VKEIPQHNSEAIVTNVLGPFADEEMCKDLRESIFVALCGCI
jgi:hypothetical protein